MSLASLLPFSALAADAPPGNVGLGTPVTQLVLRFRADVRPADGQALGGAAVADLQRIIGRPVASVGVSRGGNQVITLANAVELATAKQLVNALRMRGDVVWAEVERGAGARTLVTKANIVANGGAANIGRLIVTFADEQAATASRSNAKPTPDFDDALTRAAGTPLHVARASIAGSWLVDLPNAVDAATAEAIAAKLEKSGIVRFATPDYRMRPAKSPNDPAYSNGDQWSLQDVAATGRLGIDATHAWDITTGSPSMVIAVVDSGITTHPDLAGRILPGYDFVTDLTDANDGSGRDADASDPGDWRTAGLCASPMNDAEDSSWHGTMVAGVLAADTNNASGVAGIDWNAQIVPVRAIGRCGGFFSDIINGMAWAAGLSVPGAPANPHPAKVINLSVGGQGVCSNQIQAIIDAILDTGTFIAVSAGNDNALADNYVPANCGGLSTVGATDKFGARTSYSNYSTNMDISAPGGDSDRNGRDDAVITTWNTGKTVPGEPAYAYAEGTSFSSPEVAGVAALMLAVNPGLLPAQIKALMAQSASPFAVGSSCASLGNCGAGIVNALGAVRLARAALGPPTVTVVEYYQKFLDHYFITASAYDIALLDGGAFPGWARTGQSFLAFPSQSSAALSPVCRFLIPPQHGDSHFFSALSSDCAYLLMAAANPATYPNFSGYIEEDPATFYLQLPDASGACPSILVPVMRLWNQRVDSHHRYTTSTAVIAQMKAKNYILEGAAPNFAIMCAPG